MGAPAVTPALNRCPLVSLPTPSCTTCGGWGSPPRGVMPSARRVAEPRPAPSGQAARRVRLRYRVFDQTNVLQLANFVLALSPMNSAADQISPVGSANAAL